MKRVLPVTVGIIYAILFSIFYLALVWYGEGKPSECLTHWLLYYPTLVMGSLLFLHIGIEEKDVFYKRGVFYPLSYFFGSIFITYVLNDIYSPSIPVNKVVYGAIGALVLGIGTPALVRQKHRLKPILNKFRQHYLKQ
jgi:hypothetical protein